VTLSARAGPTDVVIRPAVESDAGSISSLVTGWAHHYLAHPIPPEAAQFLDSLTPAATAERIRSDKFAYYVAVDGDGIRGVIAIREGFHLYHLFVRADSQGKGVARALWEHARSRCGSSVFVVNSSLPAVAVYERFGFVVKDGPQSANGLTFVPMEYSAPGDGSTSRVTRAEGAEEPAALAQTPAGHADAER
jgi:GNAT superfamily N-acetyltransferase